MKEGDKVSYFPTVMKDDQLVNSKIIVILKKGGVFDTDMALIEGINHWVPCFDLTLFEEKK